MTKPPAVLAATVLCLCTCIPARAQASTGEPRFRELYKEAATHEGPSRHAIGRT